MNKNKILRYKNTDVSRVFDKEAEQIKQIQSGELDQALMLWQVAKPTLVLPAGNKWPESEELKQALANTGWQLHSRRTGGAPVPQTSGLINLSHLYVWPEGEPYSITIAYQHLVQVLKHFFTSFGLDVTAHATPHSYCDGDYNLNIEERKIVGTAQRVILKKGGGKIVLAQACILIDGELTSLVEPVNTCYQVSQLEDRVKPEVHVCLNDCIKETYTTDQLYQKIVQAFIDSQLYL